MASQDLTLVISEQTVTSAKVTISGTPAGSALWAIWYEDVSYTDANRDGYSWFGGVIDPLVTTNITVRWLKPGTTYYVRAYEIPSGGSITPSLAYDYSAESSFNTNDTLSKPRISGQYCTDTPTTATTGPGEQVDTDSTSIRVGVTYTHPGGAAWLSYKYIFTWSLEGSNTTETYTSGSNTPSSLSYPPYHDFTVSNLPEGGIINYTVALAVVLDDGSGTEVVGWAEGYIYVFPATKGDAQTPSEILVEPIWEEQRPGDGQGVAGPICYFAGTVRNINHVGISKSILKYSYRFATEQDTPLDRMYYTITEHVDTNMTPGRFILDSDSNMPIIYAPKEDGVSTTTKADTLVVNFTTPTDRWQYNEVATTTEDPGPHLTSVVKSGIFPDHRARRSEVIADEAFTVMRFGQGSGADKVVLSNSTVGQYEPEYLVLKFTLPTNYHSYSGLIRAAVKLCSNLAYIDKSLTSTVFAMACTSAGAIVPSSVDSNEPAAFSSTEIALIPGVCHAIPVERIIQYFLSQGETTVYIRLQLGSAYTHTEHSGSEVTFDTGYISCWGTRGKEYMVFDPDAPDPSGGGGGAWELVVDDNYAPRLELFQTDNTHRFGDAAPATHLTNISSVPLTRQQYEYISWNGIREVTESHKLVNSYANTLTWNQDNEELIITPRPSYVSRAGMIFQPLYVVLRYGGYWGHVLQPGLIINGMTNMTENLGINEMIPGMVYGGEYPLTCNIVGAILDIAPVVATTGTSYTFIDKSTGRLSDFDELGVRMTETESEGGVTSGIYPGEQLHYYYYVIQAGIWGEDVSNDPQSYWKNLFLEKYGVSPVDQPDIDSSGTLLTFRGSQINQEEMRKLIIGAKS
jgi:hypothetical protein